MKVFVAEVTDRNKDFVTLRVLRHEDTQIDVHEGMEFVTVCFTDESIEEAIAGPEPVSQ